MPSGSGLVVETALRLAPLDRGQVVAGHGGVGSRHVRWVTVMEGPAENFVAPGELVLTIGAGYDDAGFVAFVRDIIDAGAVAVCVAVGTGAPIRRIPPGVLELGDEHDCPIVALSWEVRFADVLRALADRLLSDRYVALSARNQLPASLTAALLHHDGLASVVEVAEELTGHPVLLLDADLQLLCLGPQAQAELSPAALAERLVDLTPAARSDLRERLEAEEVVMLPTVDQLGLRSVLATTARAHAQCLGYVLAVGDGRQVNVLRLQERALLHAGVATAIELLRRRAAADAEARVHGDFLWEVANGVLTA